ncbi:uncharacterized protein LOC129584353 isoform X2 [Paramacrobiotus metropolitanus]|nr:uncharacterized protein LOC129584353 isoform X2 [Paramacrobiotus metropolitanus]XP_055332481.1 uncharacterized protein LOC129584353 isoform X2 [Paramacrobiotus metropolitanus]XP_055332482.1 uncharacterized protein LOC129584353 isoform X2 [Paramacrobiotus metropolitanus]XP_055332483.1 uncharacterized protein LOC129584353 isoform X2 [Paramacrobiotus metropolitanus]XP_055332484.1 uncharacterized protein LOC129584353 isoform X2 [Paramacrobiotus metropolitanus]
MGDVIQRVLDDHSEIKHAYERLQQLQGEEADKWFNQLIWSIAKHSAAEELIVYPMLDKLGGRGKALAEKSRQDHQKTKEVLCELDGKKVTPDVRKKIEQMMSELLEHIGMEEGKDGDLEVIRQGIAPDELMDAGKQYERTRMFVPTHPHPNAPDKPPFENVAGLLALPMDKLRDLFRSFPDEVKKGGR